MTPLPNAAQVQIPWAPELTFQTLRQDTIKHKKLFDRMTKKDGQRGSTQLGWPGDDNYLSAEDRERAVRDSVITATAAIILMHMSRDRRSM